jgi:stage II sporulation protein GA (sporulation sigma-E factor processing peptidase)
MNETYVIYADIQFLINFILDFLCLYMAGAILSAPFKVTRLVAAAFFGGIYSVAAVLIFSLPPYITLPIHIAAALLLCLLAYGFGSAKTYFIRCVAFIITSAFTGGIITAVFSLTGRYYTYNGGFYAEISPVFLIVISLISVGAAYIYAVVCRKRLSNLSVEAVIEKGGKKYNVKLLVDSGMFVVDPLTGKRVVIVSYTAFGGEIPSTPRVIPIKTATGSSILYGFKPDKLTITLPGGKEKEIHPVVAVDNGNESFSGYNGLISPSSI